MLHHRRCVPACFLAAVLSVLLLAGRASAQTSWTVTTYAGNGEIGPAGNGGPAIDAALGDLWGWIRTDAAGNVYFSMEEGGVGSMIRRIDAATGIIDLVEGTVGGYIFDVDGAGNIYFAEQYYFSAPSPHWGGSGARIRRVDASTGAVTTYAGGGEPTDWIQPPGFSQSLPLPAGDGGLATNAFIAEVGDLALDSAGNLLICERAQVRKVNASDGLISTVAGGSNWVVQPVCDPGSSSPVASWLGGVSSGDGGPASAAGFESLWGITVDSSGNVYVSDVDSANCGETPTTAIRRIDAVTGVIDRYAGNGEIGYSGDGGPALSAELDSWILETDAAGNLYISEWTGGVIRKVDATGTIDRVAGVPFQFGFAGDGGPADQAVFNYLGGMAFGPAGELYVVDYYNYRIRRIAPLGFTPVGADVTVEDIASDGTAVSLQFDQIDSSGVTSVVASAPGGGQSPPDGFKFGMLPVVYQLESTSMFTGDVHVCFGWEEGAFNNEAGLRLFHSSDGVGWTDVTDAGSPDTVNNIICGTVSSFSYFAFLEPVPDADGDGLSDDDEALYGTSPFDPDSDDDGLLDGTEVDIAAGTGCPDPLIADSDGDGLADGAEVGAGTNPCNADTDADGVIDSVDPTPTQPGVTSGWLEQMVRGTAAEIAVASLDSFAAPNANAAKGRRNALTNRASEAANAIAAGDAAGALQELASLLDRLDGETAPPDWMIASPQVTALANDIEFWITLLEVFGL